jgi:hypothetical protein
MPGGDELARQVKAVEEFIDSGKVAAFKPGVGPDGKPLLKSNFIAAATGVDRRVASHVVQRRAFLAAAAKPQEPTS